MLSIRNSGLKDRKGYHKGGGRLTEEEDVEEAEGGHDGNQKLH